jgi:ribosomal protein S18 acetylase RimI-like enzyme
MYYKCDSFIIAPINASNLPQVLAVYQQCEDFLTLGPVPKASMDMVKADFEHSKEENGLFCGIFDLKESLVGIVDFVPNMFEGNPERAFISLIMISQPYRNKGLGRKIIEAVESKIKENRQVKVILSAVQTNNERAIHFWKELGYSLISEPESRPDKTVVYRLCKNL